jgi:alpha-L-rhamnosidase
MSIDIEKRHFTDQVITPKSKKGFGIRIRDVSGNVENPENLLKDNTSSARLIYPKDGQKPKVIIDLGPSSPCGYPVFSVKSTRGTPVLRIAYADFYDYIADEKHAENGDFVRGCCKYLGVELPVLPANPNRFEQYTLHRNGVYTYPLLQGQQRFVLLTLDTEDTEVALEYFYILITSDLSENDGHFRCNDKALNRLWYASSYTVQIASIDNSVSWEVVDKFLAVRALTKGNEAGIYRTGISWRNYVMEFDAQIARNPHCASGIGWIVRAEDADNGYVFRLDLDGTFHKFIRKSGVNHEIFPHIVLKQEIRDNVSYRIRTVVKTNKIKIYIDDVLVDAYIDKTHERGSLGFCQTTEKWALVERICVTEGDQTLLDDDFQSGLDDWEFTRSLPFIADGAKRDRLPWSGDLDWAVPNACYAFKDYPFTPGVLQMLANRQTPEGYLWAACYPEDTTLLRKGEYGYYESDIFSAWLVPPTWKYLLFTDDSDTVYDLCPNIFRSLDYLWSFVEGDGLFYQRYATSKGSGDTHSLNDVGKYAYSNLVVEYALYSGAFIAQYLGFYQEAAQFRYKAKIIRNATVKNFWDEEKGYFKKSLTNDALCELANPMALANRLLSSDDAARCADNLLEWLKTGIMNGKIVSLLITGFFHYGFDDLAYRLITKETGVMKRKDKTVRVSWLGGIDDDDYPATTRECMHYPVINWSDGFGWGDLSHPDTAMAHILTGYLLGIRPQEPGYKRFTFHPYPCGLEYAEGIIPTPSGEIRARWEEKDGALSLRITHPEGLICTIVADDKYEGKITLNGKAVVSGASNEPDRPHYGGYKS